MMNRNLNAKNTVPSIGLVILLLLLSACASNLHQAPVVERSQDTVKEERPTPVEAPSVKSVADNRPTYTVKRGDTLLRIAFDLGLNYRDIVAWNSLSNPNDIKVDQVLFVGPPDANGLVKINPINANQNVEVRNLTPINPSTNKSSPRGDKKVYSEATLADMQKAESSASAPVQVVKTEPPVVKPVEKIVTETIDWMWPTDGKAISTFDEQRGKGIDISGKLGQDVFAVAPGKVIYEGNAMRGYGNIIIVKHANNYLSAYAHNKTNLVKEGQPVARGQKIAEMGNTDTDSVKLHFEIRQAGKPVDPLKLLPQR